MAKIMRMTPIQAAIQAKEQGIVIYTVGVGKKDGSYIRIKDESGNDTLLKDRQGQVIKSRLDEITLNKITLETDGLYTPAYGTQWGLEKIYKDSIAKIEESTYKTQRVKRYINRFQFPLFVALVLIALESFLMDRKNEIELPRHVKRRMQLYKLGIRQLLKRPSG